MSILTCDVTSARPERTVLASRTATLSGLSPVDGARSLPAGRRLLVSTAVVLSALTGTGTAGLAEGLGLLYPVSGTSTARLASASSGSSRQSELDAQAATNHEVPQFQSERDAVRWLHAHSGLTWDQLGRLFGVSRRTVHLWASGSGMNSANAEALYQLVGLVAGVRGEGPRDRRAALMRPGTDGLSALDSFRSLRAAQGEPINAPPWRPEELLGARHDLAVTEA